MCILQLCSDSDQPILGWIRNDLMGLLIIDTRSRFRRILHYRCPAHYAQACRLLKSQFWQIREGQSRIWQFRSCWRPFSRLFWVESLRFQGWNRTNHMWLHSDCRCQTWAWIFFCDWDWNKIPFPWHWKLQFKELYW